MMLSYRGYARGQCQQPSTFRAWLNNASPGLLGAAMCRYGVSDGEPTEEGLRLDAQAALDYLLQHDDIDSTQIVAYGASLGGAVAIDLVARNPEPVRAAPT